MAYSTSSPPTLMSGPLTGAGKVWMYRSTDSTSAVDDSGYFTNGYDLGMRVGDLVYVFDTDTSDTMSLHRVTVANTTGSVTISTTGVSIT
jgi:hypothetical protein